MNVGSQDLTPDVGGAVVKRRKTTGVEAKPIARKPTTPFNLETFLTKVNDGRSILRVKKNHLIFSQGDAADAVFYMQTGRVKLSMLSPQGKEAVVAILGPGDFLGESCLEAGKPVSFATATVLDAATLVRIEKTAMTRLFRDEPACSGLFMTYVLTRNVRIQEDLVDQLLNSAEKRLARILLLLFHFGKEGKPEPVLAKISQETLAEMIGTTRSRVSFFLNKFRRLGFIKYNGGITVHSSLLNVVLYD